MLLLDQLFFKLLFGCLNLVMYASGIGANACPLPPAPLESKIPVG